MSARKMRIANKAARERERWLEQHALWEEQCQNAKPLWEQSFNDEEPEDWAHDEYARWTWEGRLGETAEATYFVEAKAFEGSWVGWTYKTGSRGLGYYKEGVEDDQLGPPEVEVTVSDLLPVTLKLVGLLADEDRMGNPLEATMQDEEAELQKKEKKKSKGKRNRAGKFKESIEICIKEAVKAGDKSHRELGLWAVDTANPNAWGGATEYLCSSAADFIALQEVKVEANSEADAENTARNLGWSMSVGPCLTGSGGGRSAGVAVGCRKHVGMRSACDEQCLPKSLQGRFRVKQVGAMCRGGFHLASGYLHSSVGITDKRNLDWLQETATVLKTLSGPWILAADFNCTEEQLNKTGWLKLVGGVSFSPQRSTCKGRTIDFFVVSRDLAGAVVATSVIDDALFSPHLPARLYIRANPRALTVRTLKATTTVGAVLPHGPLNKSVLDGVDTEGWNKDQLYGLFLTRMEDEAASLMALDGREKAALEGRSEGPKFVVTSALGENSGSSRRTIAVSRAWRRSAKWLAVITSGAKDNEKQAARRRLKNYEHPAPRVEVATMQQKRSFAKFEAWKPC